MRVYDVCLSTRFGIRAIIIRVSIRVRGLHLAFWIFIFAITVDLDTPCKSKYLG